jgi:hypothetical protein
MRYEALLSVALRGGCYRMLLFVTHFAFVFVGASFFISVTFDSKWGYGARERVTWACAMKMCNMAGSTVFLVGFWRVTE